MNTIAKTVADFERAFGKRQPVEARTLRPVIVRAARYVPTAPEAPGRCCERAERVQCVCRASWSCATHGTTCVGSHD
jgi:hypothetical protein